VVLAVVPLALRPRSATGVAVTCAAGALAVAVGAVSWHAAGLAAGRAITLTGFLAGAIWLAGLARNAGLTDRIANAVTRAANGRHGSVFVLVCGLSAALTATLSLDGAVVVMAPLVTALARGDAALGRPLLLGCIGVANAFSLALPQGNPTNLVIVEGVGVSPASFITHLSAPAVVATGVCVAVIATTHRHALQGRCAAGPQPTTPLSGAERLAVAALLAAAVAGAAAPWAGVPPWAPLVAIAAVTGGIARLRAQPVLAPAVPWRVGAQVLALLLVSDALAGRLELPATGPGHGSLAALLAMTGIVATAAALANNLPTSVVVSGLLASRGAPAYAALTGMSVGALATPHGSVATMIAFEQAERIPPAVASYLRFWLPTTALATLAATSLIWLLG